MSGETDVEVRILKRYRHGKKTQDSKWSYFVGVRKPKDKNINKSVIC